MCCERAARHCPRPGLELIFTCIVSLDGVVGGWCQHKQRTCANQKKKKKKKGLAEVGRAARMHEHGVSDRATVVKDST